MCALHCPGLEALLAGARLARPPEVCVLNAGAGVCAEGPLSVTCTAR